MTGFYSDQRSENCLPVIGCFTEGAMQRLLKFCRASVAGVLGDINSKGQTMSKLASLLPCPLCERLAAGSLAETAGQAPLMPLSAKAHALKEAWGCQLEPSGLSESRSLERKFYDEPLWIGKLADSLGAAEAPFCVHWLQEARACKTWLLCSAAPRSGALGLIDSRVLLEASSKRRSSSKLLSRVYSAHNRSDGPSRGKQRCGRLGCTSTSERQIDKKWQLAESGSCRSVGSGSSVELAGLGFICFTPLSL